MSALGDFFHVFLESTKFAYGVRSQLGDMDYVEFARRVASSANSNAYAQVLRQKIGAQSAMDANFYGAVTTKWDHGTAHMSAIDDQGNGASLTASINL